MLSDKKRVLMVIDSPLLNSGVPNVVMNIIRELHDRFIFDILTYTNEKGFFDEEFLSYGGEIFHVQLLQYRRHRFLYGYRGKQLEKAVRNILRTKKYDIIHCNNGEESGPCLKIARKMGVSVRISHSHSKCYAYSKNPVRIGYFNKCLDQIKSYATVRLACSEIAGKTIFKDIPFENILNPVDYSFYSGIIPQKHDGINLLQIGYYADVKDQLFSIHLLDRLAQKGHNAKLYFIGFILEQDYYDEMNKLIATLGLENSVSFLPSDTDKRELLPIIDYVLLPSKSEGLSMVALESQAANIKCILSDAVPKDVDFGLAFYAEKKLDVWEQIIFDNLQSKKRSEQEIEKNDKKYFSNLIADRYDMEIDE